MVVEIGSNTVAYPGYCLKGSQIVPRVGITKSRGRVSTGTDGTKPKRDSPWSAPCFRDVDSSNRVFVAAALALDYLFCSGQGFSFYLFNNRTPNLSSIGVPLIQRLRCFGK
jgi:hypothetical protein